MADGCGEDGGKGGGGVGVVSTLYKLASGSSEITQVQSVFMNRLASSVIVTQAHQPLSPPPHTPTSIYSTFLELLQLSQDTLRNLD